MAMPINLAVVERRKSPRRAVSQVVGLELDDGLASNHPGLLVTDLSDGGARVFAQNVEIPNTFALVFVESGIRRECRKVWQIGPEVGVEFIEPAPRSAKRRRPREA
jgi:hypothetical protein